MYVRQTCCFTGHRNIPSNEQAAIQKRLEAEIEKLILQGVAFFACGGALGFDTMAALAVLKLRQEFSHIQLLLVLPYRSQARGWNKKDRRIYNQTLNKADKVIYTSEFYYNGCTHKRNRHLVDQSEVCVCYLKELKGGTAYTVDYAKQKGLRIINLSLNKD